MGRTPFGDDTAEIMFFFARLQHAIDGDFVMDAWCGRCGHQGPLDPAALARRFSPHTSLRDLEKSLVCMRCFPLEGAQRRGRRGCEIIRYRQDGLPYGWRQEDMDRWLESARSRGWSEEKAQAWAAENLAIRCRPDYATRSRATAPLAAPG